MRSWYLDYAAATPVDPRVLRAMRPYFTEKFGNPGSLHHVGAEVLEALDKARDMLAKVAGVDFREVVFTASATEANNLALRGAVRAAGYPREANTRTVPKIIVSVVEHDSVLETARDMERAGEIELVVIPVDKRGVVDITKLEQELNERTVLVSVMYVNNELGTVQPIEEISRIIRARPTPHPLFHIDAAQAFLYYPCDVKALGVDLMTLSSQKIYGPKGAGALVGKVSALVPIVTGGGQEFGLRAGTENIPAIAGFAVAAEIAERERAKNVKHAAQVRNAFVTELIKMLPGVEENVKSDAPHIANILFPRGASSEDLLVLFDREGIAASPGAACSARALTLSHVLQAIGVPDERIKRSIRFSFGRGVTEVGARAAARAVAKATRYILDKKS